MLPVVSCKACIVFVSGVGRKIVQIPVTLFFQVPIPGQCLTNQLCNFFSHDFPHFLYKKNAPPKKDVLATMFLRNITYFY